MADEISPLRSEVIEKFIEIESWMDCIISQHYFEKLKIGFVSEVLWDEYFSFALKRRVLLKICQDLQGDIESKLNRLNTIRNYFAHIGKKITEGPDPNGPLRIPDPRDFTRSVNFTELYKEFVILEPPVAAALIEAFKKKGGQAIKKST